MKAISKKYPNLIIVAGTVLTRKEKRVADLPRLLTYYDSLNWLEAIEKLQGESKEHHHLWQHKNQIEKILQGNYEKDKKIIVTSNKARVYYRGIEMRHGKMAPYHETKDLGEFAVYQPGKGNNLNPIIKINDELNIAVSICREMQPGFDLVKHAEKKDKPMLHFILSHSIPLPVMSLRATKAAIQVDSRYDPIFVLLRDHKVQNGSIKVYPLAVDEKITKLNYIVKSVYPVQFQILDRIDEELRTSLDMFRTDLEGIKSNTVNILSKFYISEEDYKTYIKYIEGRRWLPKPGLISDIILMMKNAGAQLTFAISPEAKLIPNIIKKASL